MADDASKRACLLDTNDGYGPEVLLDPYPLVNVDITNWKDPPFLMGNLTKYRLGHFLSHVFFSFFWSFDIYIYI